MINLIDGGIQHSNLFLHMPLFDEITYEGHFENHVKKFRAVREDQACQMFVLNVIRREEDVIWGALKDLLERCVVDAAHQVRGIYVLDWLAMDIHKEIKTFKTGELTTTLVKHLQKMTPGAKRLVKYSSVYGLAQKMVHEDWGKITLKTAVQIFKDKPCHLDLLVKQLIKHFEFAHDPGILLLNDLSLEPLFNPNDELQQTRLAKLMEKQIPKAIEYPPEVYIQDKNGVRELLSGSII